MNFKQVIGREVTTAGSIYKSNIVISPIKVIVFQGQNK